MRTLYSIRLFFRICVAVFHSEFKLSVNSVNNTDLKEVFPFVWIFQQISDEIHKF